MSRVPTIVLCVGYPSTGKTTSTQRLQMELSGSHNVTLLTTLSIRERLGLMDDLYSEADREQVYQELIRLAGEHLGAGTDLVILDGNFNKRARRSAVYHLAARYGAELVLVECRVSSMDEIEKRLQHRERHPDIIANKAASLDLYHTIKDSTDPLGDDVLSDGRHPCLIAYNTEEQTVSVQHGAARDPSLVQKICHALTGAVAVRRAVMPSAVTAIVFDIGGVLQALRWEMVSNHLSERMGALSMDAFRNALYYEKEIYFGRYEVGDLSADDFWSIMAWRLDMPKERIADISASFKHLYGVIDPEVDQLVRELGARCPLYILSNSCPELEEAVGWNPTFYQQFRKIYFSHHIGYKKPDPRCYQHVLNDAGVQPSECIFVDDVSRNVIAAEAVGMRGILFLSAGRLRKSLESYLHATEA